MTYKNIFWRKDMGKQPKGKMFANVHLLVGYNSGTIAAYQEMAAELRKTFPFVKDSEIYCSHVTKSSYCESFTMISFNMAIEKKEYPGWGSYTTNPEYRFH